VLAIDRARRWILARAVEGAALSERDASQAWASTVRVLARIQIDSISHATELAEHGCPTRDLAALPDELDRVLASYRRILELGPAAVAEFAGVLAWLLGMLVEAG